MASFNGPFRTFGTSSDTVVDVWGPRQSDGTYADGIILLDETNPGSPISTPVNFITLGYADNAKLDGVYAGGVQTLPSATWTILDSSGNVATVFQEGLPVVANNQPFVIRSAAPTVPYVIYGAPRVRGAYKRIAIYSGLNGEPTIMNVWNFQVE